MTALDVITQARERLGDEKKQRWTDNRLLSIVSQGQTDICIESGYLRKESVFPLVVGNSRFILPSDCVTIKRVEYQGKLLPLHSRSDLDDVARVEIDSEYIAYKSNLQMNKLEVQPPIDKLSLDVVYVKGGITEDSLYLTSAYGVVTSTNDPSLIVTPSYGVITGVEGGFIGTKSGLTDLEPTGGYGEIAGSSLDKSKLDFTNDEYGVVVEAEYIFVDTKYGGITEVKGHTVSGRYGITTSISSKEDTIHIYYIAAPSKLKFIGATLALPDIWEDILMRYVVGTALQDDNDANNIARGEAELQKYLLRLETIKTLSSKDFSGGASDKYTTNFRRI